MTKRDLQQIYYLNREVEMWQDELDRMRCRSIVRSPQITGMPHGGGPGDPVADAAAAVADVEAIIRGRLAEIQVRRKEIMDFIDGIDDSLMRQIVYLRCVCCMQWSAVADEIGGGNTAEGVRQAYRRYMDQNLSHMSHGIVV